MKILVSMVRVPSAPPTKKPLSKDKGFFYCLLDLTYEDALPLLGPLAGALEGLLEK